MTAALTIDGVGVDFAGFKAVNNVSMIIEEGELRVLLGANGAGKTTLMDLISGKTESTQGRVFLYDTDITNLEEHRIARAGIGRKFQIPSVFKELTVRRNLEVASCRNPAVLANLGFGFSREARMRVDEVLELTGLTQEADAFAGNLSHGQTQWLELGLLIVQNPKVLLLDEPLAALDKKLRGETQFELMHLKQELGLTFMIVTHDQEEAMTVADRIGVMNHGRLMQVATAPELYEQPNSRWVADFVGDVNLIEGKVIEAGANATVIESAAVGRVRAGAASGAKAGDTVWVALRPEKVRLSLEQRAAIENSVSGTVRDIAYLGDLSIYKVALDNGVVMEAATANLTRVIERPISWDDRVWLTWDAAAGIVLTQ